MVDLSADKIVGEYLYVIANGVKQSHKPKIATSSSSPRNDNILEILATSENLWERRIAIISTYAFIKHGQSAVTLQIADVLLHDSHDLIQKAVGWMLREVGKRVSRETEVTFLKTRYKTMPRTMLRYAIEHFLEEERKSYLRGEI